MTKRSHNEISAPISKRLRVVPNKSNHRRVLCRRFDGSLKKLECTGVPLVKAPTTVGSLLVFGTGTTGQLGLGEDMLERKRPMPLKCSDDVEMVDVSCGGMHSVATTKDGRLWSYGCNDNFALGRSGDEYIPAPVENFDGVSIVKVQCSDSCTMALSSERRLFCWGSFRSDDGHLGFSTTKDVQETPVLFEPMKTLDVSDIAAGADHCLALTRDGRVFSWGNSTQFQLGRRVMARRLRNGLIPESLGLKNIKLVACGSYHSLAVADDNTLYSWGLNNYQQCGLSGERNIMKPTAVTALHGKGTIKSVQAGEHHTLVLMETGEVYAFGRADSSQLGLPADLIDALQTHEEGVEASLFKKAVGVPTKIPGLKNIVDVATGTNHSIALNDMGTAYTWGFGECYALGNGDSRDEAVPAILTGQKLDGHRVLRVAAGAQHSLILATPI